MSYATPQWVTLHPNELPRNLISYASPFLGTPHTINYAAPYELRHTLWATPDHHERRHTLSELRRTLDLDPLLFVID